MGMGSINAISNASSSSAVRQFDPGKMLEAMVKRFVKKTDKDGDGSLSGQELSKLSTEAFTALDTDGDGKLSVDEIKSALQKAADQAKQALSSDDRETALAALKESPEGQLMQLMRANGRHHHGQGTQQPQSVSGGTTQISSVSIQINITQTTYNFYGVNGTTQNTGGSVDLTA